ncbi:S8 family serine peptidase [Pullulanibacillus sp. KACC 23026]|uniref:S8 family serine peptidase n=1 Tax=Pullulanibacillus sp. KACC 23026 TaxID=3028315 RepID=UPI0023AFAB62|nr:S8 family serine peptidase [Pullulanibacillus sp. KACC 23026]WEG13210.1 S8 family serine peptidase [Pullulanibacillus sp. KACC 23026]
MGNIKRLGIRVSALVLGLICLVGQWQGTLAHAATDQKQSAATGARTSGKSTTSKSQHLIVIYKNNSGKEAADNAGQVEHQFKSVKAVTVNTDAKGLEKLKSNHDIAYIAQNVTLKTLSMSDKNQGFKILNTTTTSQNTAASTAYKWNVTALQAPAAWSEGDTGAGVKVAVIDTGIGPNNNIKLAGGYSAVSYTSSYNDDNGHGTHVAGIIASQYNKTVGVEGIAAGVSLYAVKALDQNGDGDLDSLLKAIDWCITNKMDIINMSLGTPTNSAVLQSFIDKAYNAGITIVAAAGNEGTTASSKDTMDYPAKYDDVIGVTAVDSSMKFASFSSSGPTAEVAAPGVNITSTYLNNNYAVGSGTSQATPHVTALLALLKQQNPTQSNAMLRTRLDQFYTTDLGATGRDTLYGYGFAHYVTKASEQTIEQNAIQAAVTKAEQEKTAANLENAENLLALLPATDSQKAALQSRLDAVKSYVSLLTSAQTKVAAAVKSMTKANVLGAQQAVDQLANDSNKTSLQQKLDSVKATMLVNAKKQVALAKKSLKKADLERAQVLVNELLTNKDRESLQTTINTIKKALVTNASQKVRAAEKAKTRSSITTATTAIEQLSSGSTKTALSRRIAALENKLIATAKSKVAHAEKSKTKTNVAAAIKAVNQLKSSSTKTSLLKRIRSVEAKQVLTAKYDLKNYKKYKTSHYHFVTERAINNLQPSSTKTSLMKQFKAV